MGFQLGEGGLEGLLSNLGGETIASANETNVTALSGEAGINLLSALLGMSAGSAGILGGGAAAALAITGNAAGTAGAGSLGSAVLQAAPIMGVLDESAHRVVGSGGIPLTAQNRQRRDSMNPHSTPVLGIDNANSARRSQRRAEAARLTEEDL